MKIFVIGGSGFLGSYLVPKLVNEKHEVTVLTRTSLNIEKVEKQGAKVIVGDILLPDAFIDKLPQFEVIIFIAMPPFKPGRISENKFREIKSITTGFIRNALFLAEKQNCPLIMTSGTSFKTSGNEIADETWPIARYGLAKAGENYDSFVKQALTRGNPKLIQVMPGQIYGPGGLFMMMYNMAKTGNNVIFGDGTNHIPRIYVEDCADAYVKIIEKMPIGQKYIIADDYACTVKEFAEYMSELLGFKRKPFKLPKFLLRLFAGKMVYETVTMDCKVTNAKAKRELGWELKYPTYKEGLKATIEAIEKG